MFPAFHHAAGGDHMARGSTGHYPGYGATPWGQPHGEMSRYMMHPQHLMQYQMHLAHQHAVAAAAAQQVKLFLHQVE